MDPTQDEFVIEQEWEFAAPQYYDFLNPSIADDGVDKWFGTRSPPPPLSLDSGFSNTLSPEP